MGQRKIKRNPKNAPKESVPIKKWYQENAFIVITLFFFFPLGLYLMWRYAEWPKTAKIIITAFLFCMMGYNMYTAMM